MQKIFNIPNFYTAMWILYYLQGVLYSGGSFISQGILMVQLLMSLYYFYRINARGGAPKSLRSANAFILMITIYGLFLLITDVDISASGISYPKYYYIKDVLVSFLPIYAYYEFGRQGLIGVKWIKTVSILLIGSIFLIYNLKLSESLANNVRDFDEAVNNASYLFVALLPLLCFWKDKQLVQYGLMLFMAYFIIMGMKRGAMFITICCLAYFFYYTYKRAKKWHKVFIFIVTIVAVFFIVRYTQQMMDSSALFAHRVEQSLEGDDSNRSYIYAQLWNHFTVNASPLEFIIGSGAWGTVINFGFFAHNDWLEIAVNNGLLGIFIYAFFYLRLYKDIIRLREKYDYFAPLLMCLIILFMRSFFSMSYSMIGLGVAIVIGFCLGINHKDIELNIKAK